jgi:hypothetical protein
VSAQCSGIRFSPPATLLNGAGEKAFRRLAGVETLFNYSPTLDNICDAQRYRAQFGRLAGG